MKNELRVLHVITRLIVGGAQENTVASVIGLRARPNLSVRLICGPSRGSEGSLESEFAAMPESLTILPELVRPINPWKDILAMRRLRRMFVQDLLAGPKRVFYRWLERFSSSRSSAGEPMLTKKIRFPK